MEAEVRAEWKRREDEAAEAASLSARLLEKFQEAQERSLRHGRLGAAMQRRVLLELAAPRALENKEMLGKHWRAAVLSGQLEAVDSAARKLQTAIARASVIREKLEAVGLDAATADVALETVKASCAVLEARLPDEQRMDGIAARLKTKRRTG